MWNGGNKWHDALETTKRHKRGRLGTMIDQFQPSCLYTDLNNYPVLMSSMSHSWFQPKLSVIIDDRDKDVYCENEDKIRQRHESTCSSRGTQ